MPEQEIQQTQQVKTDVNTAQFTGMGFVGIKKVEYFTKDGESVMFDDITELLENRNYANNLMLGFFSIKPFGVEKVEKVDSILGVNEDANEMAVKQGLKKAALFDFSEAESGAGKIEILVAADCIMHWDNEGSYIQPTQENSILLDLEDIIREYSAGHEVIIYSQRDLSNFTAKEFTQKPISEVPVKTNMWYNQPTFQQIYGNAVLTMGLITLALAYGALSWQKGQLEDISSKISSTKTQKINEGFYNTSTKELKGLKESLLYKDVVALVVKDVSNSLSKSGFKLDSVDFKQQDGNKMLVTVTSKENEHTQFSVQEPLAQRIIDNSQTIKAIRKQTTSNPVFILEALVDLKDVKQEMQKVSQPGGR